MSKYTPLKLYLQSQTTGEAPMSFDEVEAVLGFRLPNSAYCHRPWWANETKGHVHAQAWLEAGYETAQVDMAGRKLVFRRIAGGPKPSPAPRPAPAGLSDAARNFESGGVMNEGAMKTARRNPLFGSMKDTFTIAPGTDLTSPVYNAEEWAEIEKEMEADWDEIERGMRGQK